MDHQANPRNPAGRHTAMENTAMSGQVDLFAAPTPLRLALDHANLFTNEFLEVLPDNLHVYRAFVAEVEKVVSRGFKHYSARTIVHVLRHHSALEQNGSPWKLNDHLSPYLARLCELERPEFAGLFEYRETKAVKRDMEAA